MRAKHYDLKTRVLFSRMQLSEEDKEAEEDGISKAHFSFQYVIGKGGFGKVWKVEMKKTRVIYAMKEMQKARVISKRSVKSVMNERMLLENLRHPFIVNMHFAFQDRENMYLAMDLLTGGDLRYHIARQRRFTEEQTQFFIACLLIGLEYCHNNNILHRDIKPENLVMDSRGYVSITDFGIARAWAPGNGAETSGTPGYMAPEVMCRQDHGIAVDYFAVQLKRQNIPEGWSDEAADFINQLIQRKPANRLGVNGPQEVKSHVWFKNFPCQALYNKEIDPPYVPLAEDNFDSRQVHQDPWRDQNQHLLYQNTLLLRKDSVQSLFNGYHYEPASISSPTSARLAKT